MNDVDHLNQCRGCESKAVKKVWASPPLPIHLWPLPEGTQSIDETTSVFVCQNCGLAQLNDMSMAFVEQLYDNGVCVFDEVGNQELRKSLVTDWGGLDFFKGKRVLELGGGNNPFLRMVPEASERWIADLNPETMAHDSADKVIAGNFETLDLPAQHFDVVCGYLVFEHFINPLAVSKQIVPSLTENGVVIIEVPNLHWLRDEHPHYMVFHQHQTIFTHQTLDYMMAVAGFERLTLFSDNHVVYAAYRKNSEVEPVRDNNVVEIAERSVTETAKILEMVRDHVLHETKLLEWDQLSLYGAGGSMSLFLAYSPELRENLVEAFDIDPRKHNHRVPGTSAIVHPPQAINSSRTGGALILSNFLRDLGIGEQFVQNVTVTDILYDVENSVF